MLSIIIPTLNEEKCLKNCLQAVFDNSDNSEFEILVVDGGSKDGTIEIATLFGVKIIKSKIASRAHQMNLGAKNAEGTKLFFLHSDVLVPANFDVAIKDLLAETDFGFFPYRFNSERKLLNYQTRLITKKAKFTGGGDQGLHIRKNDFLKLGGFNVTMAIMEDFEFKDRALKAGLDYEIVSGSFLKVSARKYEMNSFMRVWTANTIAFTMYLLKIDSKKITRFYSQVLR